MRKVKVIPRSLVAGRFIKQFGLKVSSNFIDHGVDGKVFHFQKNKKNSFIVVAHLDKDKDVMSIIILYKKFIERYADKQYILYIIGEGEESKSKGVCSKQSIRSADFLLGKNSPKRIKQLFR